MIQQKSKHCRQCQRKTLHARERFSDGWGVLLTILTAGLFLPIWLLIGVANSLTRYRCQTCGQAN